MSTFRMIEEMEERRLLSATLAGGVLTITGTANSDNVLVASVFNRVYVVETTITPGTDGGRPTFNTTRTSFARADVHSIEANLGAGNDRILVNDGRFFSRSNSPIPATLNGEAGNDVLAGGSGGDTINGGDGNDVLLGNGGNDTLNGGAGDDFAEGGGGNDTINGDSGDDTLSGGAGDDTVNGDDGKDRLSGGRGTDILNGGANNDLINAIDFDSKDTVDGGGNDATGGDTALVDRGDTVTNVETVRTAPTFRTT